MEAPSPDSGEPWRDWLDANGDRLWLFARQETRSAADAEDVLQDALVRTWRAAAGGRIGPQTLATAFRNVRRCAIDHARKQRRRVARETQAGSGGGEPIAWFDPENEADTPALESALRALPEKLRRALTLKVWGGLSAPEIGRALGISSNTAASRCRYALEALRRALVGPAAPVRDALRVRSPAAPVSGHSRF